MCTESVPRMEMWINLNMANAAMAQVDDQARKQTLLHWHLSFSS